MNNILGLTLTGLITGVFAGLVGSGAEILIVPLLTIFGLLNSLKRRIGTSLFMILPPIGIFSAMKFYNNGYVDIPAALYLGVIFTFFSYFSSKVTISINETLLRKIFAIFTIVSGIYIYFYKE
tara:strand:- start:509 stop:877 length:369 start_codon:yes stop_codon:yes gene_type:complete